MYGDTHAQTKGPRIMSEDEKYRAEMDAYLIEKKCGMFTNPERWKAFHIGADWATERERKRSEALVQCLEMMSQGCQNLLTIEQACVDAAFRKEAQEALRLYREGE